MTLAVRKVPGGKLVRLARTASGEQIRVQLSGDFFIHPEEGVYSLEEALRKLPETARESEIIGAIEQTARIFGLELIGIDAPTIAQLFKECCECGE